MIEESFSREKMSATNHTVQLIDNRSEECYANLLRLREIIFMQIPSMSKDYITKLLFDGKHESLVVRDKKGEVAGGACYRYFPDNKFIELIFVAIHPDYQKQGCGRLLLQTIKREGQNRKMGRIITYADYFATNFFRKEGFCKGVSLSKEEWEGYIKDYRSANLMEYIIKPSIDYEYMIQIAEAQKKQLLEGLRKVRTPYFQFNEEVFNRRLADWKKKFFAKHPYKNKNLTDNHSELLNSFKTKQNQPVTLNNIMEKRIIASKIQCSALLKLIEHHPESWLLKQLAEKVQLGEEFKKKLKNNPTILSIRKKLLANDYETVEQFCIDVEKMISCAKIIYPLYTIYAERCQKLEEFIRSNIQAVRLGTFEPLKVLKEEYEEE